MRTRQTLLLQAFRGAPGTIGPPARRPVAFAGSNPPSPPRGWPPLLPRPARRFSPPRSLPRSRALANLLRCVASNVCSLAARAHSPSNQLSRVSDHHARRTYLMPNNKKQSSLPSWSPQRRDVRKAAWCAPRASRLAARARSPSNQLSRVPDHLARRTLFMPNNKKRSSLPSWSPQRRDTRKAA